MTGPAGTAYTDQRNAAIADADVVMELLVPTLGGDLHTGVPTPPWATDLVEVVNTAPDQVGCEHINPAAPQPTHIMAWAPTVRLCTACACNDRTRAELLPGNTAADRARADETCDACHQHLPNQIALSVVRCAGMHMIWFGLCRTCRLDLNPERTTT